MSDVEHPVPKTYPHAAASARERGSEPVITPAIMLRPPSFSAPPSASVARGPYASKNNPPSTEKNAPKCAALPTEFTSSCVSASSRLSAGEKMGNVYNVPLLSITHSHSTSVSHFDAYRR